MVNKEERCATYMSAISTLVEDAPEIILLIYIIASGVHHDTFGRFSLLGLILVGVISTVSSKLFSGENLLLPHLRSTATS